MGGEIDLVLTVDEAQSMVKVDTAAIIHVIGAHLSSRCIQLTLGVAHKMIDRHALTGKQVVFLEHTIMILDDRRLSPWRWTLLLLSKLASGTLWWVNSLTSHRLQLAVPLCLACPSS